MNLSDHNKLQEYTDDKYSVYSFQQGDGSKVRRITCAGESICILPFDLNEHRQVKHVYLAKHDDYITGKPIVTCISDTLNQDEHDTYLEAVSSCLKNEMGLTQIDVDDIYFLGKLHHSLPFSKEFRCFGVNLSKFIDSGDFAIAGFKPNPHVASIEKVRLNRLVKGEVTDSLALSCALLLLSYLSE